ncbi:MAG: FHA domain-containing protein, partial [Anaerolineales bacterium]
MNLGTLRVTMPAGQTREFAVEQPAITAGRAGDNELVLDDISVSRRHARLSVEAGQLSVEDLNSANGTYIGDRRLPNKVVTPVVAGEVVRIGDVELRYEPARAPAVEAPVVEAPVVEPPAAAAPGPEAATLILPGPTLAAPAANRFGSLRISTPDGKQRVYSLEQPTITIGRAADNQLVIDEASISRRHARLTVDGAQVMIEDLGSANGTTVGGQRLQPNTPTLVVGDQAVRLGDVELHFVPPGPPAVAAAATPTRANAPAGATLVVAPPATPVQVTLKGPAQPVAPGAAVTAVLTIQNRGVSADEFVIRVSDVPAAWVRLSMERVTLPANGQEQVTITFAPPRSAEAVATDHRFTVSVISREHHTGVNAVGVLKVLPYAGFALSLQPVRSRRDFQVLAENQGNAPATYRLSGVDDENALLYSLGQDTVSVPAGQTLAVPLQVIPKAQPRIGASQIRPFSIVGAAVDQAGAGVVRAEGQLIIRPPIPIWLIPVVLLLTLCVCIGLAYAAFTTCPTFWPGMPFCPSGAKPVINVFTAKPQEVDKGGSVVIAWDVSNAEKVEFVLPAPNTVGPTGLQTFRVDANATFTIKATNFAGSVEKSITVNVRKSPPVIQSFTANPGVITAGQTDKIVLSWTVLGATSVSIEGVAGQEFPATGSVEIPAPAANTTFTLVAAN